MTATNWVKRVTASTLHGARWGLSFPVVAVSLFAAFQFGLPDHDVQAQNAATKVEIPTALPQTLITKDGVSIAITYYKSTGGKESPVIVLLHMKDGNRFVWQNGFAEVLQKNEFAVITVDLRGHGESKGAGAPAATTSNANQPTKSGTDKKTTTSPKKTTRPAESTDLRPEVYDRMVTEDMEAVKKFIFQEHQAENLNMNKLGIVGPEMAASVSAYFARNDWSKSPHPDGPEGFRTPRGQDVRALALISPQSKIPPGLPISEPLNALREPSLGIAFLVCVGKNEPQDKGQANKLYQQLISYPKNKDRMYFQDYPAKFRGTDLLAKGLNPSLETHMLAFFDKHLKKLPANWRDRRSKLDKPE